MDLNLELEGQPVRLTPERAVFLPEQGVLLVADVHLGKAGTFRQHGIPLPEGLADADLARLGRVLERTGAHSVIVLGDLIHARAGLTSLFVEKVARWRSRFPVSLILVEGNHDRHAPELPPSWNVERKNPDLVLEPFRLAHSPDAPPADCQEGRFLFCGHLHPTVRVTRGALQARLPCFWVEARRAILPAFSDFTGGPQPVPALFTRAYVIVDGRVLALPEALLRAQRPR